MRKKFAPLEHSKKLINFYMGKDADLIESRLSLTRQIRVKEMKQILGVSTLREVAETIAHMTKEVA